MHTGNMKIIESELKTLYYNNAPEIQAMCILGVYSLLVSALSLWWIWC